MAKPHPRQTWDEQGGRGEQTQEERKGKISKTATGETRFEKLMSCCRQQQGGTLQKAPWQAQRQDQTWACHGPGRRGQELAPGSLAVPEGTPSQQGED